MRLEINMQPLTSGIAGFGGANQQHLFCDAQPSMSVGDDGVQYERVNGAVPGHIDESNERTAAPRADPSEAMSVYLSPPVIVHHAMTECFGMQAIHATVPEFTAPSIGDVHLTHCC